MTTPAPNIKLVPAITTKPLSRGSEQQMAYVERLKEKGYARLTAVFVPKVLIPEVRELIKAHVAEWEANTMNDL